MSADFTALFTDRYELTMLRAAARQTAPPHRRCSFEVFGRRLPDGRRFGVVAGHRAGCWTRSPISVSPPTRSPSSRDRGSSTTPPPTTCRITVSRRHRRLRRGRDVLPYSPILSVYGNLRRGRPAGDAGAVRAQPRLGDRRRSRADGDRRRRAVRSSRWDRGAPTRRPRSPPPARRTSPASPRPRTSPRGARYGIPTAGTAAHAFTLLHDTEEAAFASQIAAAGVGTTLLVDTYDIGRGIDKAIAVAGTGLGAVRIDSGDLAVMAHRSRAQLDALGATATRIVVSGDLDEYSIAAFAAAPVDVYGAGTAVVVGSGAPTAGLVYKLVEVDGRPVEKRSENKGSQRWTQAGLPPPPAVRNRHRRAGDAAELGLRAGPAGPPAQHRPDAARRGGQPAATRRIEAAAPGLDQDAAVGGPQAVSGRSRPAGATQLNPRQLRRNSGPRRAVRSHNGLRGRYR